MPQPIELGSRGKVDAEERRQVHCEIEEFAVPRGDGDEQRLGLRP